MNLTGWSKSLEVTADGEGIVSHAGLALLRQLTDKTGLTGGLSRALASPRLLIHDRGRVTADLACAIADGSEVISDFRVMTDQKELFGSVASVPTTWRTLDEIAAGGPQALYRITRAVNSARRQAWGAIEARHGALPGVRIADKILQGVTCIRLDATVTPACSPALGTRSWPADRPASWSVTSFRRVAVLKVTHSSVRWRLNSQSRKKVARGGRRTSAGAGWRARCRTRRGCR